MLTHMSITAGNAEGGRGRHSVLMKEDAAEELKGLFLLREREPGVRGRGV